MDRVRSGQLELKIGQSRRRRIDGTQPPEFAAPAQYGDAESMAGRAAQGHEQDPTTFEIGDGFRSLRLAVFGEDQQRTVSLSLQLDPDGWPVGGFDALRPGSLRKTPKRRPSPGSGTLR